MRYALLSSGLLLAGCLGGPMAQTPGCAAYVACVRALDADAGTTTNLDRFLPGGACWVNQPTTEGCATGCERGLAWLAARTASPPPECTR